MCKYIHTFLWRQSQKLFITVTFGEMDLKEQYEREAVTFYSGHISCFISFFFESLDIFILFAFTHFILTTFVYFTLIF